MSEWKEYKLGDTLTIISENNSIDIATLDNYISTENMIGNFGGIAKADKLPNTKRVKVFSKGDILFSNIRTYFKKVWLSNFAGTASADVLVFRIKDKDKFDNSFLFYCLCNPDFTEYSVLTSKGAKMPRGDKDAIKSYIISLPPLPEQKAIAEVLSGLDDKIDLLHRQNQTLEQMAETLFRQWFIEQADDNWEVKELGDYVEVVDNRGKTPPNISESTEFPIIEVNALGNNDRLVDYSVIRKYVNTGTYNNWFRNKLKKYDTLISTVGSIGALSMYIIEKGNVAQNVIGLTPINISAFYLYQILKYKTRDILNLDIGGVQPSIKVPHLLSMEIIVASLEKQQEFDSHVREIVNKMEINHKQINTLKKLRDMLMPELLSGEIRVKI